VDWYREHGYAFLVLSDHNVLSEGERWIAIGEGAGRYPPDRLAALRKRFGEAVAVRQSEGRTEMRLAPLADLRRAFERPGRFLMIQGEELTDWVQKIPVHHNVLDARRQMAPPGGATVRELLERTVRLVEEEEKRCGCDLLLHLNHPNYGWAVTAEDLAHVLGERFFEVYNGHRFAKNEGDATHPSAEKIWDIVLTLRLGELSGEPVFALATDDAHEYHEPSAVANPGRGWIVVRAPSLETTSILSAMRKGDFYASSGVALTDVVASKRALSVRVAAEPGVTYTTRFIGTRLAGGKPGPPGELLAASEGSSATYRFEGDELYVRATVVSSRLHPNGYLPTDHETAWVQPVVVQRLSRPSAQ